MAASRRGRHSWPAPDTVVVEPHRGLHESGARRVRSTGERARIGFVALSVVALVVVLAAALSPLRSRRPLVQPRPIPAAVSQPPLVPQPPTPTPTGAAPPGFPTAIPTAVSPTPTPDEHPPVRTVTLEAESAANTLAGAASVREVPGASGGLVVTSIGSGPASTLGFANVVVPAAGTYTLTVFYVSGADTAAAIKVDGAVSAAVAFPATGGDEEVASLALRIRLSAGRNTVEFGNPAGGAPDIDKIAIGN